MEALLGESLVGKAGAGIPVKSIAGEGKVVGLYFSAHWCPPCRGFTPQLVQWYKTFRESANGKQLEIVFISSDRDESSWQEYYGEMPWLALCFQERDRKAKLSKQFKVKGIPMLVFVDGSTGKKITDQGRNIVQEDPNGEKFPWEPETIGDILKGSLLSTNGQEVGMDSLDGCILALYFSAHWCPPCKHFTPELIKTYKKIRQDGKKFEIIFCSSDRDEASFKEYFGTMPWLALPFGDERKQKLASLFNIEGIPALIIIGENRKVITKEARGVIEKDSEGKDFPWYPKPLNELTNATGSLINEETCLVYLTDGKEKSMRQAQEALHDQAEALFKETDQHLYFFYGGEDDICDSLRDYCKLGTSNTALFIIDANDGKIFVHSATDTDVINKDVVAEFVSSWQQGKVEPRNL